MDNKQQAKGTIRSVADRLKDLERGEAARRRRNKQAAQKQWTQEAKRLSHQLRVDPRAVIEQHTWVCPYCSRVIEPLLLDAAKPRRPIREGIEPSFPRWRNAHLFVPNWLGVEEWLALDPEQAGIIRKDKCGCEGERVALEAEASKETAARSTYAQMQSLVGAYLKRKRKKSFKDYFKRIIDHPKVAEAISEIGRLQEKRCGSDPGKELKAFDRLALLQTKEYAQVLTSEVAPELIKDK